MNSYLKYAKLSVPNKKFIPKKFKDNKINLSSSSNNLSNPQQKRIKGKLSFSNINHFSKDLLFFNNSPNNRTQNKIKNLSKVKKISQSMNNSNIIKPLISSSSKNIGIKTNNFLINKLNHKSNSKNHNSSANLSFNSSTLVKEIKNNINNNILFNYSNFYTSTSPNEYLKTEPTKIINKKQKSVEKNKSFIEQTEKEKKFTFYEKSLDEINSSSSKSQKYNTIKGIFEESLQLFNPEERKFLYKILNGYHDVIYNYAKENKKLKEVNESTTNNLLITDKNLLIAKKQLQEKQREIDEMRNRHSNTSSNLRTNINTNQSLKSSEMISGGSNRTLLITSTEKREHLHWRVDGINKRNLEDLDALYFPDKVQMEGSINCINSTGNRVNKTGEVVPFLDLQSYNEDESIKNE